MYRKYDTLEIPEPIKLSSIVRVSTFEHEGGTGKQMTVTLPAQDDTNWLWIHAGALFVFFLLHVFDDDLVQPLPARRMLSIDTVLSVSFKPRLRVQALTTISAR